MAASLPVEQARCACALYARTAPDRWHLLEGQRAPFPIQGVWFQGPNGFSAFVAPEPDGTAALISVFNAKAEMTRQERHFFEMAH